VHLFLGVEILMNEPLRLARRGHAVVCERVDWMKGSRSHPLSFSA